MRLNYSVVAVLCWLAGFCGWMPAAEPEPVFFASKLDEIEAAIVSTIKEGETPGAVFWLERNGTSFHHAYGERAIVPEREFNSEDTIYDAASLTKSLATAPAILLLIESGKLQLDAPVSQYLTNFTGGGKEAITLRHLLTHTSGLRPGIGNEPPWTGVESAIRLACAEEVTTPPGTAFRYSDINFIVLGEMVRVVSGKRLDEFCAQEIYGPLKMKDTGFLPSTNLLARIAPTERVEGQVLRGVVHDPTSRRMGGVAGHAGLFTTAADMARYARMLLNEGSLEGAQVFKPETVRLMTSVQSPTAVESRRGLGLDIDSGYSRPRGRFYPIGSFGHTGWTGTCLWIDPFSKTFWIFLSNRVHPKGGGNVLDLEGRLGTLTAQAVNGFNFAYVPGALAARTTSVATVQTTLTTRQVLEGIDVLEKENFAPLKGLRIGLIANHTAVDHQRRSTIDLLKASTNLTLKVLFSPEHGIRGEHDEKIGDSVDEKTGLPVCSLYGEHRQPLPEQLKDLDALVFDIQDIGCRFYTYISTLGLCMEAAGQAHLKFFVLDRVNPIDGLDIDGPVWNGSRSFTAFHKIPVRHGMTVGELARMYNAECGFNADLQVIPVEGWKREFWFDQTMLPWMNPSPNMRSLPAAILYPGVCLLEATELSMGRGTDRPFEMIGAPYIDDVVLAGELNRAGLPGVRFVPVRFTPTASVFKDKPCGGVSILLTDRETCPVLDVGLVLARTLHRLYPKDFTLEKMNNLLGDTQTLEMIKAGKSNAEIKAAWKGPLDDFKKRRAAFLLYR
jgi:uncharacterized protein YbbC (DUF1343 family)/CubicO group peptidase (beta-lactamase class C family)